MLFFHSYVIKSFFETSDSVIVQAALISNIDLADTNSEGRIQMEEIYAAVNKLDFTLLKDKIFKRGNLDGNGILEF